MTRNVFSGSASMVALSSLSVARSQIRISTCVQARTAAFAGLDSLD